MIQYSKDLKLFIPFVLQDEFFWRDDVAVEFDVIGFKDPKAWFPFGRLLIDSGRWQSLGQNKSSLSDSANDHQRPANDQMETSKKQRYDRMCYMTYLKNSQGFFKCVFFQISRGIMLLLINNIHTRIYHEDNQLIIPIRMLCGNNIHKN